MLEGAITERQKPTEYKDLMADAINTKSLLQTRAFDRMSGTRFFGDNKIRTCSYIKQNGTTFTAVPFYDKRNTREYPTRSSWTTSISRDAHSNKSPEHAGMGLGKTLTSYNPNHQRSRNFTPDYIPPIRNRSSVMLGDSSVRDTKHYTTTYKNCYRGTTLLGIPDSHPGIAAYKNEWVRRQIDK